MQIHVASSAVIGGEVKNCIDASDGAAGDARLGQVRVDKFNLAAIDMVLDIIAVTARKVVSDAHDRAPGDQLIGKTGADERGAARDEHAFP
jgi:hypothetical protein